MLEKLMNIFKPILILIVIILSGMGWWNAENGTVDDTIFTCIWCLSLVYFVDRLD